MDERVGTTEGDTRHDDGATSPTGAQIFVRSIPGAAVALIGLPSAAKLLPAEIHELWWLLSVMALLGLAFFVQHRAQPPHPRLDEGVSQQRWQWALSSVIKTRAVPVEPGVRTAATLTGRTEIGMFIVNAAFFLGGALGAIVRPEFPWLSVIVFSGGLALGTAFRLRRNWVYLRLVHAQAGDRTAERTSGQQGGTHQAR